MVDEDVVTVDFVIRRYLVTYNLDIFSRDSIRSFDSAAVSNTSVCSKNK